VRALRRKSKIAGLAVVCGLILPAGQAYALTVHCTNCSTVFNQAQQLAKEIETQLNTLQTLQTVIAQYQDMVTQGLRLPQNFFEPLTKIFSTYQDIYSKGKALAGNVAGFDTQFRNQFGDYNRYLQNVLGQDPNYVYNNYQRWTETGADAMRVAMKSAGMNVSAIDDEDAMLTRLVAASQSAAGRMQAIQAGNQIAAMQVQQMQKLRQMLNDMVQSQSYWYAIQIEQQGLEQAEIQKRKEQPLIDSRGPAFGPSSR